MASRDKLSILTRLASGNKIAVSTSSKRSKLRRSPRVYESQEIQGLAERFVHNRAWMTPRIFDTQPPACQYFFGKVSQALVSAQERWAIKFLVDLWRDREKESNSCVRVCDDFRLALSWVSGLDLFSWKPFEYFFHVCTEGKIEGVPLSPRGESSSFLLVCFRTSSIGFAFSLT